jgi:hypothetical protein
MTSRADRFRRIADRCRAKPGQFGLREHAVYLVRSSWSGASFGEGFQEETQVPIQVAKQCSPKVRFPSQRELALGMMGEGDLEIGPFTPNYGPGGFDRDDLNGSKLDAGEALLVRVIGPQAPAPGVSYRIKNVNVDRALRVTMVCKPAGVS